MTDQEYRHVIKLYDRLIEFNSNKKLKNKAVLRLFDLISYLFTVTTYTFIEDDCYIVHFDLLDDKVLTIKHYIGYGFGNTAIGVIFNGRSREIFAGNRTKRNLICNVNRVISRLPDQVKCEMYLKGIKITYDPDNEQC